MPATGPSRSLWILLGVLSCFSLGTQSDRAQNPPWQVIRTLGGSASLPVYVSSGEKVTQIEWKFTKKGGPKKISIARFEEGELNQTFSSRFQHRLEMANETTLMIKDLEMEDSGEFAARVRLALEDVQEHLYSLSVFEPVPEPQITLQRISTAPDRCNVTLRCQALGKGRFRVSWETGNPPGSSEGGLDWYQLSVNGSDLLVLWWPKSLASKLTCLASNPAGWKKASVDLRSICAGKNHMPWWVWLAGVLVLLLAVSFSTWLWKRKSANRATAVSSAAPQKGNPSDPLYDEIPESGSPPAGGERQRPGISLCRDRHSPTNLQTVYTMLQVQLAPTNSGTVYSSL